MFFKSLKRVLSFISILTIILGQTLNPVLTSAQEAIPQPSPQASESPTSQQSSPSPTPAPSVEPSPNPSPTPQPSETPSPSPQPTSSPTPAPSPSHQQEATPSAVTRPQSTATASAQINDGPVVLGQTYHAPQNDKATVTFTKLPPKAGNLTIKQITLSKEQIAQTAALSEVAYDITSTMENGTFEYTLTLPAPTTQHVKVKASEDGQTFVTLGGVTANNDILTITGLNHFTVFVVVGTIEEGDEESEAVPFDESGSNVLINEFVYNANPEWVELYNRSDQAINLSGWRLKDANSNPNDDLNLSGTILGHGLLVFQRSQGWLNNTTHNGDGDTIFLKNGNGQIVDQVTYRRDQEDAVVNAQDLGVNPATGDSIGRKEDGSDTWRIFEHPTKGYNNNGEVTFLNVGSIYPFTSIANGLSEISGGGTINVQAGSYDESSMEIRNEGLRIIGPGIGQGITRAVITVDDCEDNFDFGDSFFHLHANNIVLQGLEIDADGSCNHVVHIGDFSEIQVSGVQVLGNAIHGGDYGVTISWGSTNNPASPVVVSDNEIYQNSQAGVLINSASNNKISSNRIHNNSNSGIKLIDCLENGVGHCGSQAPSNNVISGNTIENNGEEDTGIHIFNGGVGNVANQNIISGNILGVTNNDAGNVFDATRNFWGDASGPRHTTLNPNGLGNSVSDRVLFRPFYISEDKTNLSTFSPAVGSFNPASFFSNGVFSLPGGATQTNTASVTINEKTTFSVSTGGGTSSVLLPSGTLIKKIGGGTIDATLLSTDNASVPTLSGFTSGVVAQGALQWGIPNLGLEFSQPITLSIFVGTSFNGQTLNVVRSTTGTSGWTSDGIVSPATCLVANGLCTFQATKASTYATTHTVQPTPTPTPASTSSSSTGGGGNDGGDGLGCATHDCSGIHPAPQSLVLGVSTSRKPTVGFAPGVLAISPENETTPSGKVKGEAANSTTQSSATFTPQAKTGQSPVNIKLVALIIIALILGFGAFKLLIK